MRLLNVVFCSIFILSSSTIYAAGYPEGNITFYNASNKTVTAQVSTFGKFNLAANQQKTVPYSTLSRACSGNTTNCTAQFYVDNTPAGSATINVETGKLVNINLLMKFRTSKGPQQVLRSVVISG